MIGHIDAIIIEIHEVLKTKDTINRIPEMEKCLQSTNDLMEKINNNLVLILRDHGTKQRKKGVASPLITRFSKGFLFLFLSFFSYKQEGNIY